MPSQIIMSMSDENHPGSKSVVVSEVFDEVLGKIFPLGPAATIEEHRGRTIFHTLDGRRVLINPENVFYVEEDPDHE